MKYYYGQEYKIHGKVQCHGSYLIKEQSGEFMSNKIDVKKNFW